MTNVSKNLLDTKTQNQLLVQFVKLFATTDEKHLAVLYSSLFTEAEKIMFIKRLAIVLLIKEGYSKYTISKNLHVSESTVREILKKYDAGQFDPIIGTIQKKSFDTEKFWATIDVLLRAGLPPQGKDRWNWLH